MSLTKRATLGKFVSRGDDLIHLFDEHGTLMHRIDGYGNIYAPNFILPDGSTMSGLVDSVNNFIQSTLPSEIDIGTF